MGGIWAEGLDSRGRRYKARAETSVSDEYVYEVGRRQEHLAAGKPLDFQAAPPGELANRGRGPYKGKISRKVALKMGST
jgi:hypothetical protein